MVCREDRKKNIYKECFAATNINYYNGVLVRHNGTPLLFLLPRLTTSKKKFSKPTKNSYRDIDFLETLLIGKALERNKDLINVKKTKLLRELSSPA